MKLSVRICFFNILLSFKEYMLFIFKYKFIWLIKYMFFYYKKCMYFYVNGFNCKSGKLNVVLFWLIDYIFLISFFWNVVYNW